MSLCYTVSSSPPPPPSPPCPRPVVEGDSSGGFLLAEEGWGLDLGVAETQVLVQIVKAIDKVTYVTAEHLKVEDDGSRFEFKETLHRFYQKDRFIHHTEP